MTLFHVSGLANLLLVLVLALGRKRISLEPLEELLAIGTDHLHLRIVDVGVDKARGDDFPAKVAHSDTVLELRAALLIRARVLDLAILDNQQAVVNKAQVRSVKRALEHSLATQTSKEKKKKRKREGGREEEEEEEHTI